MTERDETASGSIPCAARAALRYILSAWAVHLRCRSMPRVGDGPKSGGWNKVNILLVKPPLYLDAKTRKKLRTHFSLF